MSTDVLDFAGLDAAASAVESTVEPTTQVETPTVNEVEPTTQVEESTTEVKGSEEKTPESTTTEVKGTETQVEDLPGDEKTPQEIRKILKAVKDANPDNAAAVKQLHGAFERYTAYAKSFPTVKEAEDAKSFIDSIGGFEGYENTQAIIADVEASDALLFEGDPKIVADVYESMKAEGKEANFPKLLSPILGKVQEVNEKAYKEALLPHNISFLEKANFPNVLASLVQILNLKEGDDAVKAVDLAKEVVADIQGWFAGTKGAVDKAKAQEVNPERLALQKEREAFNKEREDSVKADQEKFRKEVGNGMETSSNTNLGKELGKFLKMPYFKAFKRESLVPLAQTIQKNMRAELEADKAYKAQMKGLWAQKNPDKAKILQYHTTKVQSIAERIVRDTVNLMYPDHAKGGSAAGRIAAKKQVEQEKTQKVEQAKAVGNAVKVKTKPPAEFRDMEKDSQQLLEITGKAYLKKAWNGFPVGTLVTWR